MTNEDLTNENMTEEHKALLVRYISLGVDFRHTVKLVQDISAQRDELVLTLKQANVNTQEAMRQRDAAIARGDAWRSIARRFARYRSLMRWSSRIRGDDTGYVWTRTSETWDRMNKNMAVEGVIKL